MPSRYRAQFINSLSGFKSANLIATQDVNGNCNLAIFSSVIHLGASPALVGFIMRPDNGDRHTLNNIINTKHYTINQISQEFYQGGHQTSARYPKNQSEFIPAGLSTYHIDNINAPFVKESKLKYAVKLREIMPISCNNTQFIIGEIKHIICEQEIIQPDGYLDIEAIKTVSLSGLDSYHTSERLSRLSYAKPDTKLTQLPITGPTHLKVSNNE